MLLAQAGGEDNLQYEHLILAKDILSPILANLYTFMLRHGYVPDSMKRGVIVTLHKGSNKRKDNPDNYRAITLTSAVMKIFEIVVLKRCKDNILETINGWLSR